MSTSTTSSLAWIGGAWPFRDYAIPLEDPRCDGVSEQAVIRPTSIGTRCRIRKKRATSCDPRSKDVRVELLLLRERRSAQRDGFSVETWLRCSSPRALTVAVGRRTPQDTAERHRPNVLIVSFKSMKRDLRGTVRKVAEFMDVRVSDQVIERVCEKSSFDYMKRIDEKFRAWQMIPWGRAAAPMMRKGTEGGSLELLGPERQRLVDQHFIAELDRLGSDFPYQEFCDVGTANGAADVMRARRDSNPKNAIF